MREGIPDGPGDLGSELRAFWQRRQQETSAEWKRTLPFADYVVDRWQKADLLGFGAGTSIYDSAMVFGEVRVGSNTWIGPHCLLDGTGILTIGDFCSISAGVQLYTHDSVAWALSGGVAPLDVAPTVIGSNCYIGPNTVVAKGVSIGDGCLIGANSLVLADVPSGSKAWGSPCRVTGQAKDDIE